MVKISILFSLGILTAALLFSCGNTGHKPDIQSYCDKIGPEVKPDSIKYAKGFNIIKYGNITKIIINKPSNKQQIINTYYLVEDQKVIDKFANDANLIKVPLDKVAVFSQTQLSSLIKMGQTQNIVGVSEAGFITDTLIKKKIADGSIVELAGNGEFYVETALRLNPDLIFYSPYNTNESHPLATSNILMVPYLDFMETSPLGRAEWIKFNACFFGNMAYADSVFRIIETSYNSYKNLLKDIKHKPSVFSDKYFAGQWYVPGGKSYIARLFDDAGADYIWRSDSGVASFPLDYEVVYKKAAHADYWRIVGSYNDVGSYDFIASQNELYRHFDAFKNKQIIWCDAKSTSYFEKGPLEPQILLADLIYCFHPELLPDYKPVYYKLLK
jgi:iron complex transport system substrate-binding protein